jgi:hypothetical protein
MNIMEHIYQNPWFGENWFTYPKLYSSFVKNLPNGSKIVEVGSWKGKSVAYLGVEIVNSGKDIKVDAVDTWMGSPESPDHLQDAYVKTNTLYSLFLTNIAPLAHVIKPIRMTSVDAAKLYEDNSLDVVFIDAGHTYEAVKSDVAAWLPKVKVGGILAGHDYAWSDDVRRAVDESIAPIVETEGCFVFQKVQ